jgi:flagellar protein FliO/FliZ
LVVWILIFPLTNISAQDESSIQTQDPQTPDPIEDPIRTRQEMMVFGGEETEAETARSASTVSVFSIFRMLLTLAVVAAAIYGLVYFLKFRRASRAKAELDPFLKILASAPLGPSRSVYVVSVGPQAWLVGSAETGVNLISEIGDKDTINAMLLEDSKRIAMPPAGDGGAPLLDFKAILERLGISTKNENSGPDQIRKRSERLKGL